MGYKSKKVKFLEFMNREKNIDDALAEYNISLEQLNRWVENDVKFKDEMKKLQQGYIFFIESILINEMKNGNLKAIELFMKYRGTFHDNILSQDKPHDEKTIEDVLEKIVLKIENGND